MEKIFTGELGTKEDYEKNFHDTPFGLIENVVELTRPPFDKPQSFIKLFDADKQKKFVRIINEFKENATKVIS